MRPTKENAATWILLFVVGIMVLATMKVRLQSNLLLNLGYLALLQGRPVQAEQWLTIASEADPLMVDAWRGQGEALWAQDKASAALAYYDKAVALCSDCLLARLGRANVRFAQNDQTGATEDWRAVGSGEWMLQLGHRAWKNRRDVESAILFYQLATQFAPKDWRGYYYWSAALRDANPPRLEQAQVGLEKALELSPQNSEVLLLTGQNEYSRGRYDQAMEAFSQYIQLRSDDFLGWYWRGLCWKAKGSLGEASLDLRQAIRLNGSDPNPHLHLAQVLEAEGDRAGAIEEFQTVLALVPGQPDSQRAIERLISQ